MASMEDPSSDLLANADPADLLARGVARLLHHAGYRTLTEFSLRNGRRADLAGLDEKGNIIIVEIKRSIPDFRSDQKWPEYLDFCDRFYFAVPMGFPDEILPEDCGLIFADRFGAEIIRETIQPAQKLHASRRKEVTLRFARVAAKRLASALDPDFSALHGAIDEED